MSNDKPPDLQMTSASAPNQPTDDNLMLPDSLDKLITQFNNYHENANIQWRQLWEDLVDFDSSPTLSSVNETERLECAEIKFLLTMAANIFYIATRQKERELLNFLLKAPFEEWSPGQSILDYRDSKRLELARAVFACAYAKLEITTLWKSLKDIFFFDLKQLCQALHFALLDSTEGFFCPLERRQFATSKRMNLLYIDVDLFYSSCIDHQELSAIRQVVMLMQKMAYNDYFYDPLYQGGSGTSGSKSVTSRFATSTQHKTEKEIKHTMKMAQSLARTIQSADMEKYIHAFGMTTFNNLMEA